MRQRVSLVATGMFGIATFLLGIMWARNWSAALVGIGIFVATLLLCALANSAGSAEQEIRCRDRIRRLQLQYATQLGKLRRELSEQGGPRLLKHRAGHSIAETLRGEADG